jgi:hypothetical protein
VFCPTLLLHAEDQGEQPIRQQQVKESSLVTQKAKLPLPFLHLLVGNNSIEKLEVALYRPREYAL